MPPINFSSEHGATKCPAFADENGIAKRATCLQPSQRISCPTGNVPLLFGTHHQITMRQNRLQMRRHDLAFCKSAFTIAMTTERPKIGPIVDVKANPTAMFAGEFHRLETCVGNALRAEMRPCHEDSSCRGNELLVDVLLAYRHISTIFTIENQRELFAVTDAQQHQRRQSLLVGDHLGGVNTLGLELLQDETPHMLITNTGDQRRLQPKTGAADAYVGRASTNIFGKAGHVLKTASNLRAIKINR